MENTAIRSPSSPAPANAVARHSGARQAAGTDAVDAKGGFSLLLADMAEGAGVAETPAPVLPAVVAEQEDPLTRGELPPADWLAGELLPGAQPSAEQAALPAAQASAALPSAAALPAADSASAATAPGALAAGALAADSLTPAEWLPEVGAFALSSLIGQTARMDGAADAALRDGRGLDLGETDGGARQAALPMGAGRGPFAANLSAGAQATGNAWGGVPVAVGEALTQVAADIADTADIAAQPSTLSLNPAERGAQPHGLAALLARMDTEATPWAMPGLPMAGSPAPAAAASQGDAAISAVGAGAGGTADTAADAGSVDAAMTDAAAPDAVLAQADDNWADQLSEQVAFWVQQKTQRAEMTIDRQGRPVQVQVTITGNEAHVTFRSSEQQTRDMLDAGTAQLREMLEQQGLNLASVTVQSGDAGGQGSASRQDSQGRPATSPGEGGQRQIAQVSVDLRARPDAARSVDLFV